MASNPDDKKRTELLDWLQQARAQAGAEIDSRAGFLEMLQRAGEQAAEARRVATFEIRDTFTRIASRAPPGTEARVLELRRDMETCLEAPGPLGLLAAMGVVMRLAALEAVH